MEAWDISYHTQILLLRWIKHEPNGGSDDDK